MDENLTSHEIAISVRNLTKIYPLYNKHTDRLKEALHPSRKKYHNDFFALKDVSFEIKKGETVGIIGKNGAGKSTLLKILTGVLSPTSGSVHINGRVSSLLELGTGFNPDLTGIENIYFYGTINGISREEMTKKQADIIAFADIGEFINQPVKTYSSGMFARLAFSVAINIDPDILIVDEVLSVGDFQFQQKCLRKMREFSEKQKTIIFVSHDTNSLKIFCKRGLLLNKGLIVKDSNIADVSDYYFETLVGTVTPLIQKNNNKNQVLVVDGMEIISKNKLYGDGKATILSVGFFDKNLNKISIIEQGQEVVVKVLFFANSNIYNGLVGLMLKDEYGVGTFGFNTFLIDINAVVDFVSGNKYLYSCSFIFPYLSNKIYGLTVAIQSGNFAGYKDHCWGDGLLTIQAYSKNTIYLTGMAVCLQPNQILDSTIMNYN